MGNAQICPQCEHIKYKLKLFNGVFFRRAALHTFMSAYAKVNSLNIKGSKNTYFVYQCGRGGPHFAQYRCQSAGRMK